MIKMLAFWVVMLITAAASLPERLGNCSRRCGDVEVPYPFGILKNNSGAVENPECAVRRDFLFFCNSNLEPPRLYFNGSLPIHNISVEEGTISVKMRSAYTCYDKSGAVIVQFPWIHILLGPFRFSDSRNKLTVIGCDTLSVMRNYENEAAGGCLSLCQKNVTLNGTCSGYGCCQVPLPKSLRISTIDLYSIGNHTSVWEFNRCDFAFISDERSLNIADWQLWSSPRSFTGEYRESDVAIEWVARAETCEKARSSPDYFCGNNSDCVFSDNGQGYRCACRPGFSGNPYRPLGCHDIDECSQPNNYPCSGTCKNNAGNYTCTCPLGMRGDGKTGCHGTRATTILAAVAAGVFVLIILAVVLLMWIRRRKDRIFIRNGGALLRHQRMTLFSEAELARATSNFGSEQIIGEGGSGRVYKGVLADGTAIAVKRAKGTTDKAQANDEFVREIEILSQVNHINVVKMLGLCLETEVPLLVYEFIPNGTLSRHIRGSSSQALSGWESRLRIAEETAEALNYLHSLADPPIIHGDVKADNILLDDAYTAKVSDFGASVLSSTKEPIIGSQLKGTFGYMDPECLLTGCLTEKSDVYSYGVVVMELLTGVKPTARARHGEQKTVVHYFISAVERHSVRELLCFEVQDERKMQEVEALAEIARNCLRSCGVDRPAMKEVVEELRRLRQLAEKGKRIADDYENTRETQRLLGESSSRPTSATRRSRPQIFRIESARF